MSNGYKQALERFEQAVRAHEMMGAMPPEAHDHIQKEYDYCKAQILSKLSYRDTSRKMKAIDKTIVSNKPKDS